MYKQVSIKLYIDKIKTIFLISFNHLKKFISRKLKNNS